MTNKNRSVRFSDRIEEISACDYSDSETNVSAPVNKNHYQIKAEYKALRAQRLRKKGRKLKHRPLVDSNETAPTEITPSVKSNGSDTPWQSIHFSGNFIHELNKLGEKRLTKGKVVHHRARIRMLEMKLSQSKDKLARKRILLQNCKKKLLENCQEEEKSSNLLSHPFSNSSGSLPKSSLRNDNRTSSTLSSPSIGSSQKSSHVSKIPFSIGNRLWTIAQIKNRKYGLKKSECSTTEAQEKVDGCKKDLHSIESEIAKIESEIAKMDEEKNQLERTIYSTSESESPCLSSGSTTPWKDVDFSIIEKSEIDYTKSELSLTQLEHDVTKLKIELKKTQQELKKQEEFALRSDNYANGCNEGGILRFKMKRALGKFNNTEYNKGIVANQNTSYQQKVNAYRALKRKRLSRKGRILRSSVHIINLKEVNSEMNDSDKVIEGLHVTIYNLSLQIKEKTKIINRKKTRL